MIPWVYESEALGGSFGVTRIVRLYGEEQLPDGDVPQVATSFARDRSFWLAWIPPPREEFEQEGRPLWRDAQRAGGFLHDVLQRLSLVDGRGDDGPAGELPAWASGASCGFSRFRGRSVRRATCSTTPRRLPIPSSWGRGTRGFYGSADVETELKEAQATVTDSTLHTGIRVVTPPFYVGRLIYDGTWVVLPDNLSNRMSSLGGDTRLRGYPSRLFIGGNLVASNVEFRTRSFLLWSILVRGALFYDVADAYDDNVNPKHGAGFGFRILFPQLGRSVMRVDWGLPSVPTRFYSVRFKGCCSRFSQAVRRTRAVLVRRVDRSALSGSSLVLAHRPQDAHARGDVGSPRHHLALVTSVGKATVVGTVSAVLEHVARANELVAQAIENFQLLFERFDL